MLSNLCFEGALYMFKTIVYSNVYLLCNIFDGTFDIEKVVGDDEYNKAINDLHNKWHERGYKFVDMAETSAVNKYGFVCVKAFITYKKIK